MYKVSLGMAIHRFMKYFRMCISILFQLFGYGLLNTKISFLLIFFIPGALNILTCLCSKVEYMLKILAPMNGLNTKILSPGINSGYIEFVGILKEAIII